MMEAVFGKEVDANLRFLDYDLFPSLKISVPSLYEWMKKYPFPIQNESNCKKQLLLSKSNSRCKRMESVQRECRYILAIDNQGGQGRKKSQSQDSTNKR